MTIGEQLTTARKARKLTQQQVAVELHVTRQTISSWEVGRSYPDLASVLALSEFFALSLDELLKGDAALMTDAQLKEQERRGAKVMYWGAYAVNIVLLVLVIMTQQHVTGVTMGFGTRLAFVLVMLINLVVLLYATRNYRRLKGPLNAQAKTRSQWLTGLMLLLALGLVFLLFGWTAEFVGAIVGITVALVVVKLVMRHFFIK
jgi:transcriptional regulator with XRE-family HTH domain